jgi:hypothetical protein
MSEFRWCSGCAAEAAFEQFDCADHPEECIELVCALCGAGIEVPPAQVVRTRTRRPKGVRAA